MSAQALRTLLLAHVRSGRSDLYVTGGRTPRASDASGLVVVGEPMSDASVLDLLAEIASPAQRRRFDETGDVGVTIAVGPSRLRALFFRTAEGIAANFHRFPEHGPGPSELAFPEPLLEMMALHRGVVLVTGPQRSGKSTALAGLAEYLCATRSEHLVSVEDPIKFVLRPGLGPCSQLEVGRDVRTYEDGLTRALDLGCSILLARDLPLASSGQVFAAAEAGVLVLASLAANDAPAVLGDLLHVLCPSQPSAAVVTLDRLLRGLVFQRLLPDGHGQGTHVVREVYRVGGGPAIAADTGAPRERPSTELLTPDLQTQLLSLVGEGRVAVDDARRVAPDRLTFMDQIEQLERQAPILRERHLGTA